MTREPDKDLFASSTMSLGEHLDELRTCLFRALIGLAVGFALGLIPAIGGSVVKFIQYPLTEALEAHYEEQSSRHAKEQLEALKAEGQVLPADPEILVDFVKEKQLLPQQLLIDPESILEQLKARYPDRFGYLDKREGEAPAEPKDEALAKKENKAPAKREGEAPAEPKDEVLAKKKNEAPAKREGEAPAEPKVDSKNLASQNGTPEDPASQPNAAEPKNITKQQQEKIQRLRSNLVPIYVWRPTGDDPRTHVKSLNSQEAFMVYVKGSLLFGFILASPWIFYQIWQFVGAGLYPHERRYVHLFLPFSLFLFLAGAALAFFVVFQYVLSFLFWFNQILGIDIDARISEWLGFAMMLPLGFGISFQLPLVMLFLERIGVFTVKTYLSSIRMAILVIFIVAMFLTPSDPQSMFLMAVPLVFLYFGGILLCKYLPRRENPFSERFGTPE